MTVKKMKSEVEKTSSRENKTERSAVRYFYMLMVALMLIIGSSVSVYAQTNPSGTPNNTGTNDYGDNRPNYNYLGLLGLLGLYGLHKARTRTGTTTIDRRVP